MSVLKAENFTIFITFLIISFTIILYHIKDYLLPIFSTVINTTEDGGLLVAKTLKAHNIKYIFTLVGGHISPILVRSKQIGIKVIDVRNEATTVFAADAISRLSGIPGVAVVTAGPGVTNTITAMKNAQMAQSPIILFGGAAATVLKGRGALQDVEQLDILKSICKWCYSIKNCREIVSTIKKAFYISTTGVPGPVFIEIPIDILYNNMEVISNMGLMKVIKKRELKNEMKKDIIIPDNIKNECNNNIDQYLNKLTNIDSVFLKKIKKQPKIVELYLKYQIKYLFGNAFSMKYDYNPIPVKLLKPDKIVCGKIIRLLKESKRPCLVISSQALLDVGMIEDIVKAVKLLNIPVFLSSMARGLLGTDSDIYIKQGRTYALRNSDFIILAGVMPDFRLDYGRVLNKKSKIITINLSYNDLKLNTDLFWKPYISLQNNVGLTLIELSNILLIKNENKYHKEWLNELKLNELKKNELNKKKSILPAFGRNCIGLKNKQLINPIYLCYQIEKYMDKDSIIIVDGGDFAATAAYICKPRGPLKWLDPGPFGTLGVGAGFVLGSKLLNKTSEIWLIWGDGSSGYGLSEIETFLRFNIGVICVIGNDACWSQIEREQTPKLGDNVACNLTFCDYHIVSKGFGGDGCIVWKNDEITGDNENNNVIIKAKNYVKNNNKPFVINAHIGVTDFREGSISV